MKNGIRLLAATAIGVLCQPATAQQVSALSQDQFVRIVDECLAANKQTEFDTPAAVLDRVRPSCAVTGTVRFPARGSPILGDLLRYDPAASRFTWQVDLGEQNRFYGGGASPYQLTATPSGQITVVGGTPEITAIIKEVGNANFWLLPLFRTDQKKDTYKASNAFGVSRDVLRVKETRYGIAAHIPPNLSLLPVLEAPLDAATAREIADHLDIALTFRVGEVCRLCYKANSVERGTRPTIQAPLEQEITTKFVYVEISGMSVIDRRTGRVIPATIPSAAR